MQVEKPCSNPPAWYYQGLEDLMHLEMQCLQILTTYQDVVPQRRLNRSLHIFFKFRNPCTGKTQQRWYWWYCFQCDWSKPPREPSEQSLLSGFACEPRYWKSQLGDWNRVKGTCLFSLDPSHCTSKWCRVLGPRRPNESCVTFKNKVVFPGLNRNLKNVQCPFWKHCTCFSKLPNVYSLLILSCVVFSL